MPKKPPAPGFAQGVTAHHIWPPMGCAAVARIYRPASQNTCGCAVCRQVRGWCGGSFDVAIRVGVLRDSTLVVKQIAPFRNRLYAAPSYIASHGQPQSLEALAEHACLGFCSHSSWPDWVLKNGSQQKTFWPTGPLISDSSESLLQAAVEGVGIILTPDWLAGAAVRDGTLVQILAQWEGAEVGGIYAVMPPGRLVPTKTRVFVDQITRAIQAGWQQ